MFRHMGSWHARDRRGQMIFMRIVGQGRISELLDASDESLEADIFFRQMKWYGATEDEFKQLTPENRELAEAYCQGVNESGLSVPLPLQLATRKYVPEPWTLADILLMIRMTAYLTLAQSQGELELLLIQMIQAGVSKDKLHELFPCLEQDFDEQLIRRLSLRRKVVPDSVVWRFSVVRAMASNNWVISGRRTASGKPILAGDIHLEVNRLPNVWCEQILQIGSRYFVGATLPGVPTLVVGRTPDLAWTPTYAFMDSEDSWIERCNEGNYLANDKPETWRPFETRDEVILRRGKQPHSLRTFYSRHGLVDGVPDQDGYCLATKWAGSQSGAKSLNCGLQLWRATNVEEGMAYLSRIESAWNWVLADRHGNIAYQMSGIMPNRRPGMSGLVPVAGWQTRNDWQGFVDAAELPHCINPEQGYFATANNDLNAFGRAKPINAPMGAYRAERIAELLGRLDKATMADVKRMHYDVSSRQAAEFMGVLRPLLPMTEQGDILRNWDCRYDLGSRGAFLFEQVYKALLVAVFGEGGLGTEVVRFLFTEAGTFADFYYNFDRVLLTENSAWFCGQQRDDLYRRIIADALKIPIWSWGSRQKLLMSYLPFQGRPSRILRMLRINRMIRLPGGRATIQQGQIYRSANRQTSFAPGYRFITDFSTDDALTNLPGGPAESPFSKWYCSDLESWAKGRYKTLRAD
jgi:penicillin amidase